MLMWHSLLKYENVSNSSMDAAKLLLGILYALTEFSVWALG